MSDRRTLFLGADHTWLFLLECALRAAIMFVAVLLLFKITGKKEVRQFTVLELIVVIGLGSALGDSMIYIDSPILPSVVAMLVVLVCYWAVNKFTSRNRDLEMMIEGDVLQIFANGMVDLKAMKRDGLTVHEFYDELSMHHVEQLGQVKAAYIEINGDVSVFFLADEAVYYGLPVAPELLHVKETPPNGPVACAGCGAIYAAALEGPCIRCDTQHWVKASKAKRVG